MRNKKERKVAQDNNKKLKKFITQERVWLGEIRMELNKQFDKYLSRLDLLELKVLKEEETKKSISSEVIIKERDEEV